MFIDSSSGASTRQKVLMAWEYFECSGKVGGLFDHFISLWKKGLVEFTFFFRSIHMKRKWKSPTLFISEVQQRDGMIVESNLQSCTPANKV